MKQKNKGHLTQLERDRMEALLDSGHTQADIARILKRDPGTISRERKRNRRKIRKKGGTVEGEYDATVARQKARVRRMKASYRGKKINDNDELRRYIIEKLKMFWGPDEISGRMKEQKKPFYASKTAIYEWLYSSYGQRYCKYLKHKRYKPKKRKEKKTKRTMIPNKISINERPEDINNRKDYRHYESDCIVSGKKTGSKEGLAVLYERKARYIDVRKIPSLKPDLFNQALMDMTDDLTDVDSITLDNGIENKRWEELGFDVYFCDSYSSWQKGGVENANAMIRRFIPKGVDLSKVSAKYVKMVADILNNKPRKILGYKTPLEVMEENNLIF